METDHFQILEHPPVCPKCQEVFTFRYQLEWHFQWKHRSLGKLFVCGECNLTEVGKFFCKFHNPSPLQSPRCACEKCGVSFETDLELRRHHLSHKDVRTYACKMCSMSFSQKPILDRHSKVNCAAKSLVSEDVCRICFGKHTFRTKHQEHIEQSGA